MSLKSSVMKSLKGKYHASPEHLWAKYPDYAVFRHRGTGKWFALFMNVPSDRLGLQGGRSIEIVNVKCRPEVIGSLRKRKGFLPAYHMNKEHWLTVLLDSTVPARQVMSLIDDSYALTANK